MKKEAKLKLHYIDESGYVSKEALKKIKKVKDNSKKQEDKKNAKRG